MALTLYSVLSSFLLFFHLVDKTHMHNSNASSIPYACNSQFASYTFCNTSLPVVERVADLVGRLTLDEKVGQLINSASGVSRLGIPPYQWWSEALHGVSNTGPGTTFGGTVPGAVSFPQVILSAASFNTSLWRAIGQVVSTEARAMYNEGHSGLTFWSPNINIYRDPRWGRGQETPGEDPFLSSQYATNYVRGLQDVDEDSSDHLKVAACCKHYTAYDLDNWNGVDRFHFNAEVTQQDLGDTYQPPFKNCIINGNAACVMCSYNRVNGVPTCVDKDLLLGTVRKQWGLNGYVASDCDSVEVLYDSIHYTQSPEDAVADAILAGLNMNCGVFLANYTAKAVAQGKLNEDKVDESLSYLYTVLMRLGYFNGDPAFQEHFGMLGASDVCTKEHRDLAVEAARQGIVLLKNNVNNAGGLPLSQTAITTLAVIGPNANVTSTMIGNYAAGRLPMSWYPESYTKVAMTDMRMRPNAETGYPGRTYRFYTGDTLYKFGDGLSYTTFSHAVVAAPTHISLHGRWSLNSLRATPNNNNKSLEIVLHVDHLQCEDFNFNIHLRVQNIGGQKGDNVVMAFWNPPREIISEGAPMKQLVGFERVHGLHPQEATEVIIGLNACKHLSHVNDGGERLVIMGLHKLSIGETEHEIYLYNEKRPYQNGNFK